MPETALPLISGIRIHKTVCLNQKLIVHKMSFTKPEPFRQLIDKLLQTVLLPDLFI